MTSENPSTEIASSQTASLLDEKIAAYIQENHKEILELVDGVKFWERFWPENIFAQSLQKNSFVHESHSKAPILFKPSFNASVDPIAGRGTIINLNDGTIEEIFNKIQNKETVSFKDVAVIHLVMSAFELELNKRVKSFFLPRDSWTTIFNQHVKDEINGLINSSLGTSLTAIKILTVCYPDKMKELISDFDKVFLIKPKQDWRKKVGVEVANDALAIVQDIVQDYNKKLETMKGIDLDQTSEQYLKSLDEMMLKLNTDTKNPHIRSTQQLFAVLLSDETLFRTVADIASRSSIYDGQSPTVFADNRKPPVIGAIIAAVKSVYEQYNANEEIEEDLPKWALLAGFNSLGEDGKAVVIRSIVEDFADLDYKKIVQFYKKLGGDPYSIIPAHFDRGEKAPIKASPFSPAQKKEVQLSHWIYDRIANKNNETQDVSKKNVNKPFKTVK